MRGSGPSMCSLSRWAYSAITRPRLSHIARTIAVISAGDFSGNAALRFLTASRDNGVGATSVRPIQPPMADAVSMPNRRKKPMTMKKPAVSR